MSLTRTEFEIILQDIFYTLAFPTNTREFQRTVTTNNETLFDVYATNYLRAQERINFYLTAWDNAVGQPAKDSVVGSVTSDLGNASVNLDNAYLWPPILGHFGDIKGPINLDSYIQTFSAIVDGTTIGNTEIFTVPSGKRFIPQRTDYTLLNVAGLSVVSTCSIGSNSSIYNNIQTATIMTGLTIQNNKFGIVLTGVVPTVGPSTQILCRVSIASIASTYSLSVSVSGYFISS